MLPCSGQRQGLAEQVRNCGLHPLIHTRLGFTLAQDIENALHKVYAVVNEGEGEGKKIPHSRMLRERGSKRRHEEKASL